MAKRPLTALVFLGALIAGTAAADDGWQDDYLYALESLQRSNYQAAIDSLEAAISVRPVPELMAVSPTVDYLPYLNLAAAYFEVGSMDKAREALQNAQRENKWVDSYVGRQLWDHYALPIMASDAEVAAGRSDYRDFDRKPYLISEDEAEKIKTEVLRRCAITGDGPRGDLPWYFHYEYGMELMEAGDPQRALDQLIMAANRKEDSKRHSRMYGMWFMNYLPYYSIAQVHTKLGNWQCAMDAMRLSAKYGEFSPLDPGFEQYSDLQKLILRQNET